MHIHRDHCSDHSANLNCVHLRQLFDEKVLSQFDVKHDVGSHFAHSEQQRVRLLRRHPVLDQPILGPTREGALEMEELSVRGKEE